MKNIIASLVIVMLVLGCTEQIQAQSGRPVAKSSLPSNRNPKKDKAQLDRKLQELRQQARKQDEKSREAERQRAQAETVPSAGGRKN